MKVELNSRWTRKEPQGNAWDAIIVVAASPLSENELVLRPVDVFAEDTPDGERQIVSTSATPESLQLAYDFDGQVTAAEPELGVDALSAWGQS